MSGLIALLDDVAAIAKVAAASLDDVAGQAVKAGTKAAGAVIDDAAVTPNYVRGFAPDRELPIVAKIAAGSIRNKLVLLLPAALALSAFAPAAIPPMLMLGGAYLCFEGAEKVAHAVWPHPAPADAATGAAPDTVHLEQTKVAGAVKTDFILSAEIMTIALAALPDRGIAFQAAALALVGIAITALVYGGVALIVKADDIGLRMARRGRLGMTRAAGRGIVRAMPAVMRLLSTVGTAAMLWVGGSIVVHGLGELGWHAAEKAIRALAQLAEPAGPAAAWAAKAAGDGAFGLILGLALLPVGNRIVAPLAARLGL